MRLQLIRNATLRLTYAGRHLLFDPFLAERHSQPSIAGVSLNPTVDLPLAPGEILRDVEFMLVSHLHPDHIDLDPPRVPTTLPVLAQPQDVEVLRAAGFTSVTGVECELDWNGIRISRTSGEHGTGSVREAMGEVSGFILRAHAEPTLYLTGDTIWTDAVQSAIASYQPDVIVTHSGGARIMGTLIIMDAEQTMAVTAAAPHATVIAVHLEAYDHAATTRSALRRAARAAGREVAERLLVPEDGETIELNVATTARVEPDEVVGEGDSINGV